jgi:DNA-binding CsgD family transcriptional regulator
MAKVTTEQRRQVRLLATYKLEQAQIAAVMGMPPTTLKRNFAAELDAAGRGPRGGALDVTPEQRSQVEAMSGLGMTQDEIAKIMGISETALKQHCPDELRRGGAKADAAVMQNLFRIATGSTPQAATAAIFWAKTRRRMHEVQRVIHGFDPDVVVGFVRQVVALLRRELPETCPHCKTNLGLPKRIAGYLREMSNKLAEKIKTEIVPIPADEDVEQRTG